jgi:hypothetical protein
MFDEGSTSWFTVYVVVGILTDIDLLIELLNMSVEVEPPPKLPNSNFSSAVSTSEASASAPASFKRRRNAVCISYFLDYGLLN